MSLKTIKVNPIFLSGSDSISTKNKTRKEKPLGVSLGQSNNIKKKLIARIKNFQQNTNAANKTITSSNNNTNSVTNHDNFVDDFSQSVNFLDNLARGSQDLKTNDRKSRERKSNKPHNTTLKKKQAPNPDAYMHIATELPPELALTSFMPSASAPASSLAPVSDSVSALATALAPAIASAIKEVNNNSVLVTTANTTDIINPTSLWNAQPPPLYSNLKKGGTKPTYRTWLRNTQKNKPAMFVNQPPIKILDTIRETNEEVIPTAQTANDLNVTVETQSHGQATQAQAHATQAHATQAQEPPAPLQIQYKPYIAPRRKKITRTLKYKLGKHANGKVSVLIKNSQTRRRIQTEHAQLKQKNILDIKNHLRSKNLLKVGSEAPNDVLRHIYEQSILAGQVENKSKDTLIHNYFNDEKK